MGSNSTNNDINLDEIIRIVQHGSAWRVVQSMIEKGVVSVYENMQDAYKPKKEKVVLLSDLYRKEAALKQLFTELERAPKQLAVLNTFLYLEKTEPVVFQKALLERAGTTAAVLQALCDKTIFRVETVDVDRLSFVYQGDTLTNTLNQEQAQAFTSVQLGFEAKKPVLLQGITGSGKTHVYVACIEKIRAQGRQVLFLVPEIALTAQLVRKLRAYLGDGVGIYHSRFNQNERVEVWNKVNSGELSIVIGARSALFLPFNDLGLVIVDEEPTVRTNKTIRRHGIMRAMRPLCWRIKTMPRCCWGVQRPRLKPCLIASTINTIWCRWYSVSDKPCCHRCRLWI